MFKIHNSEPSIKNPNNYGPKKSSYYINKLLKDFEHEVVLQFKKIHFTQKIMINYSTIRNELKDICSPGYGQFIGLIRPIISSHNWQVINLLKMPMNEFFNENPNDIDSNAFVEAFENVIQFWKEYEF